MVHVFNRENVYARSETARVSALDVYDWKEKRRDQDTLFFFEVIILLWEI